MLIPHREQDSSQKFLGGVKAWPNCRVWFFPIPAIPPYLVKTPHIHGIPTTDDTTTSGNSLFRDVWGKVLSKFDVGTEDTLGNNRTTFCGKENWVDSNGDIQVGMQGYVSLISPIKIPSSDENVTEGHIKEYQSVNNSFSNGFSLDD